jgi:tol-pal system protein YbgF
MHYISKTLVAGGLVILTGPFCLTAQAQQGYVDLEAEQAAAAAAAGGTSATTSSAAPADPYGAQPAQIYPATSYGLNTAPAGSPAAAPAASSGAGQNLGNLFYQIQQLQQEVRRLNGKVEEQAHELRVLKEQSLQRYMDLDKRVSGGAVATAPAAAPGSPAPARAIAPSSGGQSGVPAQVGEKAAYQSAYALVKGNQFDQAVQGFQAFLQNYPDGKYAANAHYWLGELYLAVNPQDLEASRQSFMLLLSQYPDNAKVPDALFKLGKVQYLKGNPEKSREYLDRLVKEYGSSTNPGATSAVKLAQDFIAQNY